MPLDIATWDAAVNIHTRNPLDGSALLIEDVDPGAAPQPLADTTSPANRVDQ